MPIKEAIIAPKKENKSLRELARALGVAESTIWYVVKKKDCSGKPERRPEDHGKHLKA